ncbi:MAG: polysaccharide deacetylase family protein [Firmicutes bacterium]|nr:polysaccharide deacetylase family protein [Bacillota bacterium]
MATVGRQRRPKVGREVAATARVHTGARRWAATAALALCAVTALGTACARGAPRTAGTGAAVPPALYRVATSRPAVALTYDDGPRAGPGGTEAIVALLKANGAHATFFVLGEEVARHPEVVRAAARAGMEIENHADRHLHLPGLGEAALRRAVAGGADAVERTVGRRPHWLRPPYGALSPRVRRVAHDLGERVVLWSTDTRDWTNPGSGAIVRRVLGRLRPGDIVLMHDGGADRSQTVEATRQLLPALRARGYEMLTLDELVAAGRAHPTPAAGSATGAAPRPRR